MCKFILLFQLFFSLALLSWASPTQPPTNHTLELITIDLEEFEKSNGTSILAKRKDVRVCGKTISFPKQQTCFNWGNGIISVASFAVTVATTFKSDSNNNDCGFEEKSAGAFNYAVSATGNNCDTTAQQTTIRGAIEKYIDQYYPDTFCNVKCFKLDHGGTWNGYLVFGSSDYDLNYYNNMCQDLSKSSGCVSGGSND